MAGRARRRFRVIAPHHPGWGIQRCHVGSAASTIWRISISIWPTLWICAMPCWSAPISAAGSRPKWRCATHAGFRLPGAGRSARHQARRRDRPRHRRHACHAARRVHAAGLGRSGAGRDRLHALPETELAAIVRGREALALFGWKPYMHNPRLKHWLHRIDLPTLVLWGEQDGIVSSRILPGWCAEIAGSRVRDHRGRRTLPALGTAGGVRRDVSSFVDPH